MDAPDFTKHRHPVQAVACPDCGARAGTWCKRPSGHKATDFHRSRRDLADRQFVRHHGEGASIEGEPGAWRIVPNGRAAHLAARA